MRRSALFFCSVDFFKSMCYPYLGSRGRVNSLGTTCSPVCHFLFLTVFSIGKIGSEIPCTFASAAAEHANGLRPYPASVRRTQRQDVQKGGVFRGVKTRDRPWAFHLRSTCGTLVFTEVEHENLRQGKGLRTPVPLGTAFAQERPLLQTQR